MPELKNIRHEQFCHHYIISFNAGEAYLHAGYKVSVDNSRKNGYVLLKNPEIQARMKELRAEVAERNNVTLDEIVGNLREVRDRCMQVAPVMVKRKGILIPKTDVDGNAVYEFDAANACRATESLGRTIGAFIDKVDSSITVSTHEDALGELE